MIEQDVDWSVLEYPGVQQAVKSAAMKVEQDRGGVVEYDDLYQEALIYVATHPEEIRAYEAGGWQFLHHRIYSRLLNLTDSAASKAALTIPIKRVQVEEEGEESDADSRKPPRTQVSKTPAGGYTRELIEQLLPAVWDSSYAFGMTNPYAPDPDMPRGSVDVSHGCILYAYLADIRWAWRKAYIPIEEKQALLLRYGMGWREREIAENQGITQQGASWRITRGVGRLRDYLNGVEFSEQHATM